MAPFCTVSKIYRDIGHKMQIFMRLCIQRPTMLVPFVFFNSDGLKKLDR